MKRKIEVILAVSALADAPLALAGGRAAYPREKVAAFVVEKLDVTSLPSAIRPRKEKGKKTLADYGYTLQKLEEKEALVASSGSSHRLSIKILDENASGIYACVAGSATDGGNPEAQSVVLLRRKDSSALLKGRESFREFASCPMIGGSDSTADSYGGTETLRQDTLLLQSLTRTTGSKSLAWFVTPAR